MPRWGVDSREFVGNCIGIRTTVQWLMDWLIIALLIPMRLFKCACSIISCTDVPYIVLNSHFFAFLLLNIRTASNNCRPRSTWELAAVGVWKRASSFKLPSATCFARVSYVTPCRVFGSALMLTFYFVCRLAQLILRRTLSKNNHTWNVDYWIFF